MQQCWQTLPKDRPTFAQMQLTLMNVIGEKIEIESRSCCICQEYHLLSKCIECSAVQLPKYFMCHSCFDGHVRTQSEPGSGRDGRISRPLKSYGCSDSVAFMISDKDIALHASEAAFETYSQFKKQLMEMRLVSEISTAEREKFSESSKGMCIADMSPITFSLCNILPALRHFLTMVLASRSSAVGAITTFVHSALQVANRHQRHTRTSQTVNSISMQMEVGSAIATCLVQEQTLIWLSNADGQGCWHST